MRIFGHRQVLNSLSIRQLSSTANSEVKRLRSTANSEEEAPRRTAKWRGHHHRKKEGTRRSEACHKFRGAPVSTFLLQRPIDKLVPAFSRV